MRRPFCESQLDNESTRCHCGYQVRSEAWIGSDIQGSDETQRWDELEAGTAGIAGLEQDLGRWGLGLLGYGVLTILWGIASGPPDSAWGVILISVAMMALIFRLRGMFIVIGVTLFLAGLFNGDAGSVNLLKDGGSLVLNWGWLGALQIQLGFWAFQRSASTQPWS